MSAGELGVCLVCGKKIRDQCSGCEATKPNAHYTEVEVAWTNGSKMKVAVCLDCAKNATWATPEGKKAITEWHWAFWDKQGGKYDKEIVIA